MEESGQRPDIPAGWQVIERAMLAACALDRQLRYRYVNARWAAEVGADRNRRETRAGELRGGAFLADLPDEQRARWSAALSAILAGRLGHFLDQFAEARATGTRQIVATASPTFGPDGQVDGVLCIRYDVTDAHQSAANEAELAHLFDATRKLQHFLGNQLALTLGYVELLTFDPRLPDELRDRVDEALRGVIGATETLARLRLLTRREIPPDDPWIVEVVGSE